MTQASEEGSQALEQGAWEALPADSESQADYKVDVDVKADYQYEMQARYDRLTALKLAVSATQTAHIPSILKMAEAFEQYLNGEQ